MRWGITPGKNVSAWRIKSLKMKFTIFSRLIFGYLLVISLVLGVSIYMIIRLVQVESITHSILGVDHQMEGLEKKLTDSLLSQMRYEKKYMVTQDEALFKQFLLARDDFYRDTEAVLKIADPASSSDLLDSLKAHHQRYQKLIEEEAGYIRAHQAYSQPRFKNEKERVIDQMLENLQVLALQARRNTLAKIVKLEESGISARQVTMAMVAIALSAVIILSFFITSGITHPISLLIRKTREIARGNFENHLLLSGPPEIKELSGAMDSMCERLQVIDKMKSDFFSTISHELRTPLTSIKEGTSLLLDGIGGEITEKQKKLLNIIAGESNRLIDLVNSSLDLSKMEAGMMVFKLTPDDITPLIRKAVGEIEPLAMAKKISLRVENQTRFPS